MSERREQRRVERTTGTGKVMIGSEKAGTAVYVMEIWQTFHIIQGLGPGSAEEVAGMKEIHIRFIKHDLNTVKLWKESATLTLHLEDGRRLDGFLNGEEFVASGQLTAA